MTNVRSTSWCEVFLRSLRSIISHATDKWEAPIVATDLNCHPANVLATKYLAQMGAKRSNVSLSLLELVETFLDRIDPHDLATARLFEAVHRLDTMPAVTIASFLIPDRQTLMEDSPTLGWPALTAHLDELHVAMSWAANPTEAAALLAQNLSANLQQGYHELGWPSLEDDEDVN